MNGNYIWGVVVLVIVIAGGWFLSQGTPAQAPITDQTSAVTDTTTTTTTSTTTTQTGVTIFYTDQGFSPKSITVTLGTTVSFVNQASNEMWVASAPHPTHQGYDGTTESVHCAPGYTGSAPFDECSASTAYSFIFTKAGDWKYHNHANPSDYGTVIVTAVAPL